MGIDSENLARVWEPYFTTRRGGTGLGLAIARNVVDGLGGSIVIESRPGRGRKSASSCRSGGRERKRRGRASGRHDRPAPPSCIADDEEKILTPLRRALEREGYDVLATTRGREARRLLNERIFDVLVVDNLMPDLSGLDLVRDVTASIPEADRPADRDDDGARHGGERDRRP